MEEDKENRLKAVQEELQEIKGTLAQVQKLLKRNQGVTGFQFIFGLGITAMIVGMTLTGSRDTTMGLVAFLIGLALCLTSFIVPRLKK